MDHLFADGSAVWSRPFFALFPELMARGWSWEEGKIVRPTCVGKDGTEGEDWFADEVSAMSFLREQNEFGALWRKLAERGWKRVENRYVLPGVSSNRMRPGIDFVNEENEVRRAVLAYGFDPTPKPDWLERPQLTDEDLLEVGWTLVDGRYARPGDSTPRFDSLESVSAFVEARGLDGRPGKIGHVDEDKCEMLAGAETPHAIQAKLREFGWTWELNLDRPNLYFRPGAKRLDSPRRGVHFFDSLADVLTFVNGRRLTGEQGSVGHVDEDPREETEDDDDLSWAQLWDRLRRQGWRYESNCYWAPNSPCRHQATRGLHFFATEDEVFQFVKMSPSTSRRGRAEASEDLTAWGPLWQRLQNCGWRCERSHGTAHSVGFAYFRPGALSVRAGAKRGVDYFESEDEVTCFVYGWGVDSESRTGHVDESRPVQVDDDVSVTSEDLRDAFATLDSSSVAAEDDVSPPSCESPSSFDRLWSALEACGWTRQENGSSFRYFRPGSPSSEYFDGREALVAFVKNNGVDGLERRGQQLSKGLTSSPSGYPASRNALSPFSTSSSSSSQSESPCQATVHRLGRKRIVDQRYEVVGTGGASSDEESTDGSEVALWQCPFAQVLRVLRACGWTWHGGSGLVSWRYFRPGACTSLKEAEHLRDYFESEEDVLIFVKHQEIDGLKRTGHVEERLLRPITSAADEENSRRRRTEKSVDPPRSGESDQIPAQPKTQSADVAVQEKSKKNDTVAAAAASTTAAELALWQCPFAVVLGVLKSCGWTWQSGSGLVSWRYFRPGACTNMKQAKRFVDYFECEDAVVSFVKIQKIDGLERTGAVHEALVNPNYIAELLSAERTRRTRQPSQVYNAERPIIKDPRNVASKKLSSRNPIEQSRPRAKRTLAIPSSSSDDADDTSAQSELALWQCPFAEILRVLRACGWTWQGGSGLVSWRYYRPGACTHKKVAKPIVDYFESEQVVIEFVKSQNIDGFDRTGHVDEELVNLETVLHFTKDDRMWRTRRTNKLFQEGHDDSELGRAVDERRARSRTVKSDARRRRRRQEEKRHSVAERSGRRVEDDEDLDELALWQCGFDQMWQVLKACGWSWQLGSGLVLRRYFRPGARTNMKEAELTADYFESEDAVVAFVRKQNIDGLTRTGHASEPLTTSLVETPGGDQTRRARRTTCNVVVHPVSAENLSSRQPAKRRPKKRKSEGVVEEGKASAELALWQCGFDEMWQVLKACGWSWQLGSGLVLRRYFRPGARTNMKEAELTADYFESEDAVATFVRKQNLDGLTRTGHTSEPLTTSLVETPVGDQARRARRANRNVFVHPVSAQHSTTRQPAKRRPKKRKNDVVRGSFEEEKSSTERALWECGFDQMWQVLKGCGWSWLIGSGLVSRRYFRPGARTSMKEAEPFTDFFESEDAVVSFVKKQNIDGFARTGDVKMELVCSASMETPAPGRRIRRAVRHESLDERAKVAQVVSHPRTKISKSQATHPKHAAGARRRTEKRSTGNAMANKDAAEPSTLPLWNWRFVAVWDELKYAGWTFARSPNRLEDFRYYKPGVDRQQAVRDRDYFCTTDAILSYLEENGIDDPSKLLQVGEKAIFDPPASAVNAVFSSDDDEDDLGETPTNDDDEGVGLEVSYVDKGEPEAVVEELEMEELETLPEESSDEEDEYDRWASLLGDGKTVEERNETANRPPAKLTARSFESRFEGFAQLYSILQEMGWKHKASSRLDARGGLIYVAPGVDELETDGLGEKYFLCANDVVDFVKNDPAVVLRMKRIKNSKSVVRISPRVDEEVDWVTRVIGGSGDSLEDATSSSFGDVCPRASAYFTAASASRKKRKGALSTKGNKRSRGARASRAREEAMAADDAARGLGEEDFVPPTQDEVDKFVTSARMPSSLEADLSAMHEQKHFAKWHALAKSGWSLLLHGIGSKRRLLDSFAERHLSSSGRVVVISGFQQDLDLRGELLAASTALGLHLPPATSPAFASHRGTALGVAERIVYALRAEDFGATFDGSSADGSPPLVHFVIHTIDGPRLRQQQRALAALKSERSRLTCSVDHINAPLMWDADLARAFDWLRVDATTFAWYDDEASLPNLNDGKPKSQQTVSLEGLNYVLQSLTARHIEILHVAANLTVAKQRGGGAKTTSAATKAGGGCSFSFRELADNCRLFYTAESQLSAFIVEFTDHRLLQRTNHRGTDYYVMPPEYVTRIIEYPVPAARSRAPLPHRAQT